MQDAGPRAARDPRLVQKEGHVAFFALTGSWDRGDGYSTCQWMATGGLHEACTHQTCADARCRRGSCAQSPARRVVWRLHPVRTIVRSANAEAAWERLASRRKAAPFLHPAFFLATAHWLAPRHQAVLLFARAGSELGAMLPLMRDGGRLTALRSLHSPRYDVVADAGAIPALWRSLCELDGWHSLELGGVPDDSLLATDLVALARDDGCPVAVEQRSRSPYLLLADFERELSGDFRRKLMARRRKIPDLSFERVTHADPRALDDMFRLEAAAWKGAAGTAISSSAATDGFYRELARRFAAAGRLSLTFLRSGERRIAAHFALEDGETYYLLKPGYDPDYARFGPGHVLLYEVAVDARARGLVELDLLGQDMEWKRSWTSRARRHMCLHVYRSGARGRASHALRHVVRPRLGTLRRGMGLSVLLGAMACQPAASSDSMNGEMAESLPSGTAPAASPQGGLDAGPDAPNPTDGGSSSIDASTQLLPDLTFLENRMASSIVVTEEDFPSDYCAIEEGCLNGSGRRRLVRFATAVVNFGNGHMSIGDPDPDDPYWSFDQCHDHYHYNNFADYSLLNQGGTSVATGRKQSFCLRDDERVGDGPAVPIYDCTDQGLSPGWADIYSASLDCQFIDVTGVPPGNYVLRIEINPFRGITESDYDNDVVTFSVTL